MRKGLSCREAGKLGGIISKEKNLERFKKRVEEYNKNPHRCKFCRNILDYEKRHRTFCNGSCAAKYNNSHKSKKKQSECLNCGKEVKGKEYKYCSNDCQKEFEWKKRKSEIEKIGFFPFIKTINETNRVIVKRYLEEKHGHKCSICGLEEWTGKQIPLVVDHIDGDSTNHKVENFRLVCGNCNMLLPTFAGRNRKSGRTWRKKYDLCLHSSEVEQLPCKQ